MKKFQVKKGYFGKPLPLPFYVNPHPRKLLFEIRKHPENESRVELNEFIARLEYI